MSLLKWADMVLNQACIDNSLDNLLYNSKNKIHDTFHSTTVDYPPKLQSSDSSLDSDFFSSSISQLSTNKTINKIL